MAKTHSAALEMQSAQTKMPSALSDLTARSEMPKALLQMPLAQAETLAGQADARSAQEEMPEMPPASVETHPDSSPLLVGVPSLLLPFTNNAVGTSSSTTTALSASLPRSMSEVFPRRHRRTASANDGQQPVNQSPSEDGTASCLGSPCSSSSLPAHFASPAAILLKSDQISAIARFAFTDLVITVLRLDFYRPSDQEAIRFCKCSLDILLKWGELPAKTQQSLRQRIEENQPFNEDIGALITAIKLDPLLRQPHGLLHLLGSLLLSVLINGDYDSRFRVLLRHISALLGIHWDLFEEFESTLGDRLIDEYKETVDNQRVRESKNRLKKLKRYAMIGAASGLGGVLIGVTGGLAAPVILTSISALTATTILLPAAASAAILGSVFGAAGAGLTGYRMQKRVGDIEEFHIERLTEQQNQGLHCVLCVSGWIEDREESAFRHHWRHLWMSKEQYTLRWESNYLEELGRSIDYFVSFVVSYAIQRSLMETMLASLVSAVAWPLVLLGSSCVIDNPWNICTRRARQVGEHLAEVLLTRQHGRRPITLIGFSLGARVLYHCLLEMSKRVPDSLGIVQDVILLGAPVSASPSQWRQLCSVVGGRVINGYCKTDWLLRFLYRAMSVQFIIAGTGPVDSRTERKIVNFNLSHIVKGHLDYAKKMTQVLEAVGVRCTPLSHASRADLSNDDEAPQAVANAEEAIERAEIAQELDEQSTVVEHLKHGLGNVKHEVDHHEAEREKQRTKKSNFVVGSVEKGGEIIPDDGGEPMDPLLGVRLRASNAKTAVAATTDRSSADGAAAAEAESARRTNSSDSTDTYLSAVSTT